jgi:ankyrin repeat protein
MTGNCEILAELTTKWGSSISTSVDRFKKTPAMYAIMNHNNSILFRLLSLGCKPNRSDTSLNTLLHYAAAYGNAEAIMVLRDHMCQVKNKRNYYPW